MRGLWAQTPLVLMLDTSLMFSHLVEHLPLPCQGVKSRFLWCCTLRFIPTALGETGTESSQGVEADQERCLTVSWWSGSPALCHMEPHVPRLPEQGWGGCDVLWLNKLLLPCSAPHPLSSGMGEGMCVPCQRWPWHCHGQAVSPLHPSTCTTLPKVWAVLPKPHPRQARLLLCAPVECFAKLAKRCRDET